MSSDILVRALFLNWLWWLLGAVLGVALTPLARSIPLAVLQGAKAVLQEWRGPGGGVTGPVPAARRIWVPLLNAALWGWFAATATEQHAGAALSLAVVSSALLLLALIDWDSTMLPDVLVLPLGLAGLAASYAGLTQQSLFASAMSAVVVLLLLGGTAWLFERLRGERGVGGGDLKLLAALGAWWGLVGVLYVVAVSSVLTALWYLFWRRLKGLGEEAEWPFGPAIVVAALAWGVAHPF